MLGNLPRLAFLPVEALVILEGHHAQPPPPLMEGMRPSGVFRTPPIVAPLQDGTQRYMVLDGANRTTALQKMGYPHALVQIVRPDHPGLKLYTWNHVVWGIDPAEFFLAIRQLPNIKLVSEEEERPDLWGDCSLASIQVRRGA